MSEEFRFVEGHHDSRGSTLVFKEGNVDYLIVHTRSGFFRGGEIHTGKQFNVLLRGNIKWVTPEGCYYHTAFSPLNCIITAAGIPHMMESTTDSVMVEWREYPLENPVNYYKPYRDIIEAKMKETQ